MPTPLDSAKIKDELSGLDDWTGDTSRLTRIVTLTDEQHATAERRVMDAANAMNHHPDIEREGNRTTFVLSTHSAGGVTELDVALARQIDGVLREVG